MASYRLLENDFSKVSWLNLFQDPDFFHLHAASGGSYLKWLRDDEVVGCIHFTAVEPGVLRSPARGTFAGYQVAPNLRLDELFEFHKAVERHLEATSDPRRLEILLPPMAHDPAAFSNQLYVLRTCGYGIAQCDLNQTLTITDKAFTELVTRGNLKRIRKCTRDGFTATRLPHSSLAEVYETLHANRSSKGIAMTMSLEQLQTMVQTFPEAVVLFGCEHEGKLAASAICLQLSSSVAYVFYWGDLPGYESYSPVVFLANTIYTYWQTQGVNLLDVGISTVDREPNFGLIQFKRGLGFTESLKVRMTRELSR